MHAGSFDDDDDLVNAWPNNGDKNSYFPTKRSRGSIDFGPIIVDKFENFAEVTEVWYGLETLTIRDDVWPWSS